MTELERMSAYTNGEISRSAKCSTHLYSLARFRVQPKPASKHIQVCNLSMRAVLCVILNKHHICIQKIQV
jgi:hypothetical protein